VERDDAGREGRNRRGESRPVVESAILLEPMGGGCWGGVQSGRHRRTAQTSRGRRRPPSSTPWHGNLVDRVPLRGTMRRGGAEAPGKPANMATRCAVRGRGGTTSMSLPHKSRLRCPLNVGGHGNCLLGAQHNSLCGMWARPMKLAALPAAQRRNGPGHWSLNAPHPQTTRSDEVHIRPTTLRVGISSPG